MIYDKIENSDVYVGISEKFKIAFDWIKKTNLKDLSDGKYNILNDEVFANVQCYTTKDDALFEAHKIYTDIQYIVEGIEKIETCNIHECTNIEKYSETNDIEFLDYQEKHSCQILSKDDFCILFPGEAHKPSIKVNKKSDVKKIVIKVKL